MSKHINALIDEIRESTENEEFDDNVGLSEEEILKFINDAQYRLHAKITAQHPDIFIEEDIQNCVANQEKYDIDFKAAFKNKISKVEYSHDGSAKNYFTLSLSTSRNRSSRYEGYPSIYTRRNGQILVSPVPINSNGTLRISYTSKIKRLDKRRATVISVEGTTSAPTSFEIAYVNGTSVDSTELNKRNRITIVDKYGTIKMDNILVSSLGASATTNDAAITIDTSLWTPVTGELIEVGDYVLSGRYATTHSELEEEVERYIQAYAQWKVLKRDSSVDSQEAVMELGQIEADIVASYADISDDIMEIPEINDDYDGDY